MDLLTWPPLKWAVRIALLLVVGAGLWVGLLYFLRYLKPSNIKQLWSRDVAEIEEVRWLGAALKLQSQKTARTEKALETKTEEITELQRIASNLDDRLMHVEDAHQELSRVVKSLRATTAPETETGDSQ